MPRPKSDKKKKQQEKPRQQQQRPQSTGKKPAKSELETPSHATQDSQSSQATKAPISLSRLRQFIILAACGAVSDLFSVSDYPAASDATWDLVTSEDETTRSSLQKKGSGFLIYSLMEANFDLNDNFENGMVKAKEEIIEECILSEEVITAIVVRMQGHEDDRYTIEKCGVICRSAFHVLIGGLWTQYTVNPTPVSSWISDVFTPLLVVAKQVVKDNPTTSAPQKHPRAGITQEPLPPNSELAVLHRLRNFDLGRPRRARLNVPPIVSAPGEDDSEGVDDSGSDMMEVEAEPPSSPSNYVWPRPGRGKSLPWTSLPFEDMSLPRRVPANE